MKLLFFIDYSAIISRSKYNHINIFTFSMISPIDPKVMEMLLQIQLPHSNILKHLWSSSSRLIED